jgi:hypothetical protein
MIFAKGRPFLPSGRIRKPAVGESSRRRVGEGQ